MLNRLKLLYYIFKYIIFFRISSEENRSHKRHDARAIRFRPSFHPIFHTDQPVVDTSHRDVPRHHIWDVLSHDDVIRERCITSRHRNYSTSKSNIISLFKIYSIFFYIFMDHMYPCSIVICIFSNISICLTVIFHISFLISFFFKLKTSS